MTKEQREGLNAFFVETFNKILAAEEAAISKGGFHNLSIKELHILEAVALLLPQEKNTMSEAAAKIGITTGALSIAVDALERKNYLRRERTESDRRIVRLYLTEEGASAEEAHRAFHAQMIDDVGELLSTEGLEELLKALTQLSRFFSRK